MRRRRALRKIATTATLAAALGSLGPAAPAAAKVVAFSGPAASSGTTVDLTLKIKRGKPVAINYFKVNSPYVYCRVFSDEPPYEQGPLGQVEPNQNTVFPTRIKVFKKGAFNETGNPESPQGRNSIMTVKGPRTAKKTSVRGTFQLTVFRGVEGFCDTGVVSFTTAPTG